VITPGQSFNGKVGVAFSQTPAYTGTISSWSGSGLPAGLSLNGTAGLISGTPTTKGSSSASISYPGKYLSLYANGNKSGLISANGTASIRGYQGSVGGVRNGEVSYLPLSIVDLVFYENYYGIALLSDGTIRVIGDISSSGAGSSIYGLRLNIYAGNDVIGIAVRGSSSYYVLKSNGSVLQCSDESAPYSTGLTGVQKIGNKGGFFVIKSNGDLFVEDFGIASSNGSFINNGFGLVTSNVADAILSVELARTGPYEPYESRTRGVVCLKNNGTVEVFGEAYYTGSPSGLSQVTSIAKADRKYFAAKNDGSLVAWHPAGYAPPAYLDLPLGLSGVTALAGAGGGDNSYFLALKNDGSIVGWGGSYTYGANASASAPNFTTSIGFSIAEGVPIITAGQTASGTVGTAFSKTFSLTDSANRPVTSWAATGLPDGLIINSTTGQITGSATTAVTYETTLTATGPGGTDSESVSMLISAAIPFFLGSLKTKAVYAGTTEAKAVYYGPQLLWNVPGWEPPAFSPSSISGLRLWLDSSVGLYDATSGGNLVTTNSSPVRRWEDRSGNGFHATGTNSPTLSLNQVNTLPALTFNGSQYLSLPTYLNGTAASFFVVAKPSSTPSDNGPLLGNVGSASSSGHYPYQAGDIYDKTASSVRKGPITQPSGFFNWHLYNVTSADNNWRYLFNGSLHFSTTSNTYNATFGSAPTIAFDQAGGSYAFNGSIAEIIVYNTALSESDRLAVSEYLRAKFTLY
jgi:hypothetical protein